MLRGLSPLPVFGFASFALLVICVAFLAWRGFGLPDTCTGGKHGKAPVATVPVAAAHTIKLLFGTQTGTAERFAKELMVALSTKFGTSIMIISQDIEEYKWETALAADEAVVFLVATYGDGEPTDSAVDFFSWLGNLADDAAGGSGPDTVLQGLSYAVFGLGNKQYEHYAAAGKKLYKALASLGATALCRRGDGDDDDDIDADFESWTADFLQGLEESKLGYVAKGSSTDVAETLTRDTVPAYDVTVVSGSEIDTAAQIGGKGSGADHLHPYLAPLLTVRELHQKRSERSCLHAELDIRDSQITYSTGDHVGIMPENSPQTVKAAAAALGLSLDTIFSLSLPSANVDNLRTPFAGPISVKSALARHADVLAPVRRKSLEALAVFASDDKQAERLRFLASPAGRSEFQAWAVAPGRTLLETLQEFSSARPPLGAFFGSIVAPIQPRYYSISSSPAAHPGAVHVTCSVVRERKGTGRLHHGMASSWLGRLPKGGRIPMWVRRSAFKLPKSHDTPLVMIGPGTGLAPFRGFMQERSAAVGRGETLGPAALFFGCRKASQDFIYADELQSFRDANVTSLLSCAFSRDGPEKVYVQDHIKERSDEVWQLLQQGSLYVCGDAKAMARDVHSALVILVSQQRNCSEDGAEQWLKQLVEEGRYQRDVW